MSNLPLSSKSPQGTRYGVLLLNLGGPERLRDVRPFLYNLFSDPDIIRIRNHTLRKLLAAMIATARSGKSRRLYQQIGGGSPLRRITENQAAALSQNCAARGLRCAAHVGMRCWKPTIDEAVATIQRDAITHLVAIPLFPQYSFATTGSCFRYLQDLDRRLHLSRNMRIHYVEHWFEHRLYLEAMADLIEQARERFSLRDPAQIHLLYSAHSIPARYVADGDPYLRQTQECVQSINQQLGNLFPSSLAFQSKVGPVKWLEPSTEEVLKNLGRMGVKRVLVVPVSFVSDHLETLQEVDIAYRQLATDSGIAEFRRTACLNLHPKFIDALAEIVVASLQSLQEPVTSGGDS